MKDKIHPETRAVQFICGCGNKFTALSTLKETEHHVEICSQCHPFFTGKEKLIDAAGRIEKFNRRYSKKAPEKAAAAKA